MTKQELQQHYQALWQQSLVKFEQHQFETDPLLTAKDDSRYGVTLLARPSEQVQQQIQHQSGRADAAGASNSIIILLQICI